MLKLLKNLLTKFWKNLIKNINTACNGIKTFKIAQQYLSNYKANFLSKFKFTLKRAIKLLLKKSWNKIRNSEIFF